MQLSYNTTRVQVIANGRTKSHEVLIVPNTFSSPSEMLIMTNFFTTRLLKLLREFTAAGKNGRTGAIFV